MKLGRDLGDKVEILSGPSIRLKMLVEVRADLREGEEVKADHNQYEEMTHLNKRRILKPTKKHTMKNGKNLQEKPQS